MIVTGTKMATLSVFFGNHLWDSFDVPFDDQFGKELIEAEENFWHCVQNNVEPVVVGGKYAGPIDRKMSFEGNNLWASHASEYIFNMDAAGRFDKAKDALKKLIPPDVAEANGHGLIAKRASNGAITIKKG